jgi:[acyl-carrier-protein] S-malonyltransferase
MVSVLVFPGQGSQRVGMAKDLAEAFPASREALRAIDDALDEPVTRVMWEGPDELLQQTEYAQPAILAHSAAVLAAVGDRIGPVAGAAGHSLGEYSAYMASGALTPVAAARLVRTRGQLMRAAGSRRPGAMAAVLGLASDAVVRACRESSTAAETVVAANLNTADQTVISGDPPAVARAGDACMQAGARRVQPLKVSGAFHSPLMTPAAEKFRGVLEDARFRDPRFPVVANATAQPVWTATEARRRLREQLTAPVRWVECIQALAALAPGARFIEVGPGSVLGGLLKRILPDPAYQSLGTRAEVEHFLA